MSYLSAGNIYRKLEKYDSAFYFNRAALEICAKHDDIVGVAFAHYNIASVHYSLKEYKLSIENYQKATEIFEEGNYVRNLSSCYNSISICYRKLGNNKIAMAYVKKSYTLAKKLDNISLLEDATGNLSNIYKSLGDFKQALIYRDLQMEYKDSLLNKQKLEAIAKVETDYEIKSRDSEITILNKNKELSELKIQEANRVKYSLLVIALLLIILLLIGYNRFLFQKKLKAQLAKKNAQLKDLNASKDKFFAIIAHDLSNPVAAFRNLSTALIENYKALSEEQLLDYLANLKKSSGYLVDLLDNLLQWALSQTKKLHLEFNEFDLSAVIQKNIDLLKQNADQKEISFKYDVNEEMVAYADKSTIDLVFRNIIANGIKFSPNGATIEITSKLTSLNVEVSIKDNGIGMTPEEVDMLFDITKDMTTLGNSTEKGSGLGLILSKEFIKKNGGEISVKSDPEKGSTFIISLPRTQLKAA
jgi:signal transduction histidine kinase